jgi:CRISPR-associated protein Cmr6
MPHKLLSAGTAAAVPDDVWREIKSLETTTPVPLGHAFELYCPFFDSRTDFRVVDKKKAEALKAVSACNGGAGLDAAISDRAAYLALQNTDTLTVPLVSIARFITGSGIDHPSENGLSFLRPYGVPYLAGSGVKGVLRAAAERKVLVESHPDWNIADIWWLFGWEGQAGYLSGNNEMAGYFHAYLDKAGTAHKESMGVFFNQLGDRKSPQSKEYWLAKLSRRDNDWAEQLTFRGLLDFWDMPLTEASGAVDVMTPHYGDYYNGDAAPHDAADPVPISMMTIKSGAKGRLTVQWRNRVLDDGGTGVLQSLRQRWQQLLSDLIDDVIKWDGFGAKAAVGYGRFEVDAGVQRKEARLVEEQREKALEQAREREQTKLAETMSLEDLQIHNVKTAFEADPADKQNVDRVNALIREVAGSWDQVSKDSLAELAEQIYKSHPVGSNPKKKRKALLESLRK